MLRTAGINFAQPLAATAQHARKTNTSSTILISEFLNYVRLVNLNLEALKKCSPEALQQQAIAAVLLALGSNHQADYYLPQVRKKLAALGQTQLSTPLQNPDFTATLELPKPEYTNQCVYLSLTQSMTLKQLQQILKQFENDCNRQRSSKLTKKSIKIVTMDIDILLIKPSIAKNSLSKNLESNYKHGNTEEWIIMADRYPFKAHEVVGIEELALTRKTNNDR